ncbi:MAG: hypothetical protein H6Q07_456 [Acidobacteria bacterium]|nr:hypothetical protein [Acidobacteriota bacterium]
MGGPLPIHSSVYFVKSVAVLSGHVKTCWTHDTGGLAGIEAKIVVGDRFNKLKSDCDTGAQEHPFLDSPCSMQVSCVQPLQCW